MTYPDPITLDLDPSGYITGLGQASQATDSFGGSLRTAAIALGPLERGLGAITPTRALIGGYVGLGAVAGRTEQQLSTLRATAKTTGANFDVLTRGTRDLAKQLPIGNAQARELVTTITRLGMATKGSEQTVISLSKTFTRLSGATGEGPAQLAEGMLQLSKATNTGVNADRVSKIADSLTTVSAKSGASATGVLTFAKAIAPMAQASGIGTTKILGISAAFTKLGEDGFGAASAFNKMLGDLNRSVREGSPEMSKYAQIVGKSAGEFEALFKANPAEAITQVTEALGRAPNAPRILESLGLEGTRNQRYIQELTQSGGLRTAISDSVSAYGSGSTTKAADKAFSGLADSAIKLETATEQAADAMGKPFLGALTGFTNALGAGASGFAKLVGSGPVQKGLEIGSPLLLAGLAAFKLIPSILTGLGIAQAATSGPVAAFRGAYGAAGGPGGQFIMGRQGRAYNELVANNQPIGNRFMAPITERFANAATYTARFLQSTFGSSGAPSMLRQAFGAGGLGAGMYLRALSETARLARVPFADRTAAMQPFNRVAGEYMVQRSLGKAELAAGNITKDEYKTAMSDLRKETLGAARPISILARGIGELGKQVALSAPVVGGRALVGAANLGMRGLNALTSGLGGPVGIGLTGLMIGSQIKSRSDDQARADADARRNATTFIDDYRVALGKATEATSTFAGALAAANKQQLTRPMSLTEIAANAQAVGVKGRIMDYGGESVDAARRRILGQTANATLDTSDMQAIQQDLFLSGFNAGQVKKITAGVGGPANLTADMTANVAGQSRDIARMHGVGGFKGALNYLDFMGGSEATFGTLDVLTPDAKKRANELAKQIDTRASQRTTAYSPEYARSQQLKEIDAAVKAALEQGNIDLAEQYEKGYQEDNGDIGKGNRSRIISKKDIMHKYGGSYTAALAGLDQTYRQNVYDPNMAAAKAGTDQPVLNAGWVARNLAGNPLAALFSATGGGSANAAVRALTGPTGHPESVQAQSEAVRQAIADARASGESMQDLAKHASEASNTLGDLGDATTAFLAELRQAAQFQVQAQAPYRSSTDTLRMRASMAADDARLKLGPQSSQADKDRQRQGVLDLADVRDQEINQAKALISARRELQVQEARQTADFVRQGVYMTQDYARQRERQEEQYGITVSRTELSYNRSRLRAEHDFNRQRFLALRDFNKQLARQAEDGARALYDPYQRIQAMPVWDAANLAGNLAEQNQAIQQQIDNLAKLRKMGGTSNMIKLLGLDDPKNAQELSQLVGDAITDPKMLAALNAQAEQRKKLGGQLVGDKDNTERQRAIEDFHTQSADAAVSFKQTMKRGAEDYRTAVNQMAEDEARALRYGLEDRTRQITRFQQAQSTAVARLHDDTKRADQEIVMDLAGYAKTLDEMVSGQFVDFKGKTKSVLKDTLAAVKDFQGGLEGLISNMGPDVSLTISTGGVSGGKRDTLGSTSGGHTPTGGQAVSMPGGYSADAVAKGDTRSLIYDLAGMSGTHLTVSVNGVNTGKHSQHSMHYENEAVDFTGGATAMDAFANYIYGLNRAGKIRATELIHMDSKTHQKWGLKNSQNFDYGDKLFKEHAGHVHLGISGADAKYIEDHFQFGNDLVAQKAAAHAAGGILTSATEWRRGHIGGEAGSEAIIPLNGGGINVLVQALRHFTSSEDRAAMAAAGGTSHTTYDHSVHYADHSQRIDKVEVHGVSMADALAQARAKQRSSNLTAPAVSRRAS